MNDHFIQDLHMNPCSGKPGTRGIITTQNIKSISDLY